VERGTQTLILRLRSVRLTYGQYIYLYAARPAYPQTITAALVFVIIATIYKLTVFSLYEDPVYCLEKRVLMLARYFVDSVPASLSNRLLLITFGLNSVENLLQAAVYFKIWHGCVRSTSNSTAIIYLRKAVRLATIGTAISAMVSLVLVILGSLSKPMWVSLTPVAVARPD